MDRPVLFDTCVFIHYFKKHPPANQWVQDVIYGNISGYSIILNDFEVFIKADNLEKKKFKAVIYHFQRVDLQTTIARRAAELGAPFLRIPKEERPLWAPDYFFAAAAEFYGLNILTNNKKHFERLDLKEVEIISYPNMVET